MDLGSGGDIDQIVTEIFGDARDHTQLFAADRAAWDADALHQRAVFAIPEADPFDALLIVFRQFAGLHRRESREFVHQLESELFGFDAFNRVQG